ncbi:BLUF domain-containing protein [Sphingobium phenoxybenzoativorans]|uniref:BLUF domain-containing protein n=1 Tax=Sphingobium phenoxybenzoativorans TaxID=1592790 RepID=UPI0009F1B7B0|nr:BLUF domain-containing protein [Sphingobium phenoxybenzoativorans]
MLQIIYISSARPMLGSADCQNILQAAVTNKSKFDVTGLLLFNLKRFLQVLEGPERSVDYLFQKISLDPRHRAVVELDRKQIDEREFGSWAMAFDDGRSPERSELKLRISNLLDRTSPSTRALFETTADLYKSAR